MSFLREADNPAQGSEPGQPQATSTKSRGISRRARVSTPSPRASSVIAPSSTGDSGGAMSTVVVARRPSHSTSISLTGHSSIRPSANSTRCGTEPGASKRLEEWTGQHRVGRAGVNEGAKLAGNPAARREKRHEHLELPF